MEVGSWCCLALGEEPEIWCFCFYRRVSAESEQRVGHADQRLVRPAREPFGTSSVLSPATRELSGSPSEQHVAHAQLARAASSSPDGGASVECDAACQSAGPLSAPRAELLEPRQVRLLRTRERLSKEVEQKTPDWQRKQAFVISLSLFWPVGLREART